MRKIIFFTALITFLSVSFISVKAQKNADDKIRKVLYFNPEVEPDIDEIKEPTNNAFFSAVSDNFSGRKNKMLRAEVQVPFDSIDKQTIVDYCVNNDADFAIVSKVRYFKVGLGKYVFSNQVVVSMKLFGADGNLVTETDHDTYRKNMRLLGSTVNSVKIGTEGAIKGIIKQLRKLKPTEAEL
ncbi:pyruvate decarboxylase [Chryseobacterium lactis]|uniref:Pyruvate decarboxylase n=1 Tax=Chryseobacterium lactis TaxID=1241981 RepID=A0A3G6RM39_CHRLC|nr:pyruvate decarboxylase [Chryseobacterium lactis]AZA82752.1 pyruvate decarboxylase [Chryseobacterium lactis]AZB03134.1 pyruvate decarboxylase [Chryseobacterium lactis]PNW11203.1 pyruvate decarboxylase [Chryseobacterium lactis]